MTGADFFRGQAVFGEGLTGVGGDQCKIPAYVRGEIMRRFNGGGFFRGQAVFGYRPLSPGRFTLWQTAGGPAHMTYSQHAALLTGYDENHVNSNDPLGNRTKASVVIFQHAW
ncbi:hypothetical protein [Paenibacillus xerothermodurans]|uniref:Uncharacterized protein n=1 Tax=Paenibacillus xerothermodurans TaxID=1977292 RepID=A0A2W1NEB3_PAEXE|nr:hypothetical protein [Paenibacillus xerothermodurans]PZE22264.1 hypothetical protein CBW46_000230 [Paenibacillus xerothermodurans]